MSKLCHWFDDRKKIVMVGRSVLALGLIYVAYTPMSSKPTKIESFTSYRIHFHSRAIRGQIFIA